jgi:hypothetical protein
MIGGNLNASNPAGLKVNIRDLTLTLTLALNLIHFNLILTLILTINLIKITTDQMIGGNLNTSNPAELKVNMRDLTWTDKELVLRVLFAKLNGGKNTERGEKGDRGGREISQRIEQDGQNTQEQPFFEKEGQGQDHPFFVSQGMIGGEGQEDFPY